jgi:uncharacterized protein (DUF362 family)
MSKINNKTYRMKRRDFLKYASMSMAAAAVPKAVTCLSYSQEKQEKAEDVPSVAPREKVSNPYMKNGKPMVAVVEGDNIEAMLMKAFEALGGLEKIAQGKAAALLKPNFVFPAIYPEITAGETLRTVYMLLEKAGVEKSCIADGGIRMMERAFERSGMKEFSQKSGAELIDMTKSTHLAVKSDKYVVMNSVLESNKPEIVNQYMKSSEKNIIKVFEPAYKSSLFINMPTLKTHHAASISCALKNNVGCIIRDDRMRLHMTNNMDRDPSKIGEFKKAIAEIAYACSPDLHIIDAREILVGYEHISYGGEVKKADVLIVSGDPVASDAYAAQIMAKHNPNFAIESTQPTLQRAEELGLGTANLDNVELIKLVA